MGLNAGNARTRIPPGPAQLWAQAGGDRRRYLELMVEHGHVIPREEPRRPGEPLLPCGITPERVRAIQRIDLTERPARDCHE